MNDNHTTDVQKPIPQELKLLPWIVFSALHFHASLFFLILTAFF